MKIETKFQVGSKVVYLKDNKLKNGEIHSINVEFRKESTEIRYCFKLENKNSYGDPNETWDIVYETSVFASKDEFINQLTEE